MREPFTLLTDQSKLLTDEPFILIEVAVNSSQLNLRIDLSIFLRSNEILLRHSYIVDYFANRFRLSVLSILFPYMCTIMVCY